MRTALLLKQHKKCECILEGIERCDRFLADYKKTLAMDPIFPAYYQKGVKKYTAIRDRLVKYYQNNFNKITKVVELVEQ